MMLMPLWQVTIFCEHECDSEKNAVKNLRKWEGQDDFGWTPTSEWNRSREPGVDITYILTCWLATAIFLGRHERE